MRGFPGEGRCWRAQFLKLREEEGPCELPLAIKNSLDLEFIYCVSFIGLKKGRVKVKKMLIMHHIFHFFCWTSSLLPSIFLFSFTTPLSQFILHSFAPLSFLLPTFEMERVMAWWKADTAPLPRCQSIYIKSTVHEITSLKDWTVDGDALGYCLLALSKKREEKNAIMSL